jgi:hypothetical protein
LEPLPPDAEFVRAVRRLVDHRLCQQLAARARGRGYFSEPAATAADVAHFLRIEPARRLGNGAVGGSWSGRMSPALRAGPRLRRLALRGLLERRYDTEGYRYVYDIPEEPWYARERVLERVRG